MFKFKLFYVEKPKIYSQLEEYTLWKKSRQLYSNERVREFIVFVNREHIGEITLQDIIAYRNRLVASQNGLFEVISSLKDIRAFLRYFKARKHICIDPNFVQIDLVERNSILHDMPTFKRRVGRPLNIEFITKVKKMRETGMTYRSIAKEVKQNPGRVYTCCNYILKE